MKLKGVYEGFLDRVTKTYIEGWAVDYSAVEDPVSLTLFIDNKLCFRFSAKQYRNGLVQKMKHPTGNAGFSISFDEPIKEGSLIEVKYSNTLENVNNSPWIYRSDQRLRSQIYFMHIAKTAGTSLNSLISRNFELARVRTHIEGYKNWSNSSYKDIPQKFDFISGHIAFQRMNKLVDLNNYFKITMVREPVSHLLSHINYVISVSDDITSKFFQNHNQSIKKLSLRLRGLNYQNITDFKNCYESFGIEEKVLFDNCQSRYFLNDPRKLALEISDFEDIKKSIGQFDLVYTTDNYEKLTTALIERFNWNIDIKIIDQKLNSRKNKVASFDMKDKETRMFIDQLTWLDARLYSYL